MLEQLIIMTFIMFDWLPNVEILLYLSQNIPVIYYQNTFLRIHTQSIRYDKNIVVACEINLPISSHCSKWKQTPSPLVFPSDIIFGATLAKITGSLTIFSESQITTRLEYTGCEFIPSLSL